MTIDSTRTAAQARADKLAWEHELRELRDQHVDLGTVIHPVHPRPAILPKGVIQAEKQDGR